MKYIVLKSVMFSIKAQFWYWVNGTAYTKKYTYGNETQVKLPAATNANS